MTTVKSIVEEPTTSAGRAFDLTIQALIILSLITFSIETLPNLTEKTRRVLWIMEVITVLVFSIEYVLRVVVADRKLSYIISFYGIIDLMAILPFYVSSGVDLRSVRVVRLLRLFRILKLVRYSTAIRRLHRALVIAREEIVLFLSVAAVMLYVSAVGIYYFENEAQPEVFRSVFHCLWLSVTTLTTVGYGDAYPITFGGRFFTVLVLMVGLGIVAALTGILASALSQARRLEDPEQDVKDP